MYRIVSLSVFLAGAFAIANLGCDRRETSRATAETGPAANSTNSALPATNPSTQTAGAAKKLPPIAMRIDDRRVEFPPAKLRVGMSDGKVVALLYSDDPKDALKDQYAGNSFYFQMELDGEQVANFADSDWRYKASSNDQTDSPYGIFLDGHRQQLQPVEMTVTFEPAGGEQTLISLSGTFRLINVDDPAVSSRAVPLLAEFNAKTVLRP
ncbi:hypothetical protein BH09PLA1_BH09PLA1_27830 [soil metagenome]